jgi:hypothetical protein
VFHVEHIFVFVKCSPFVEMLHVEKLTLLYVQSRANIYLQHMCILYILVLAVTGLVIGIHLVSIRAIVEFIERAPVSMEDAQSSPVLNLVDVGIGNFGPDVIHLIPGVILTERALGKWKGFRCEMNFRCTGGQNANTLRGNNSLLYWRRSWQTPDSRFRDREYFKSWSLTGIAHSDLYCSHVSFGRLIRKFKPPSNQPGSLVESRASRTLRQGFITLSLARFNTLLYFFLRQVHRTGSPIEIADRSPYLIGRRGAASFRIFHGLLHNAKLALHSVQLSVINYRNSDPYSDRSAFKNNFPKWRWIGVAVISFGFMCYGWWHLRNNRRIGWGFCWWFIGIALWGYTVDMLISHAVTP